MSDDVRSRFGPMAANYARAKFHSSPEGLREVLELARPQLGDLALDVATGTGHVALALAPHLRRAYGLDLTREMLDQARRLASERGIANVSWREGDVAHLPYPDGAFTIVVTRFAVHHFPDPPAVFREMLRVCAPGGRVVLVDTCASPDPAKAAEFNRLELLRDPSHARCLPLAELKSLFHAAGLGEPQTSFYELRDTVDNLLARSFPNPGDEQKIIDLFTTALASDYLGIPVRHDGDRLDYAYPVAVLAAAKS